MPTFDFSFKSTNKNKSYSPKSKNNTIIYKNIKCVIDLTDDLRYVAFSENNAIYAIHPDCYNCKGHNRIYSQLLHGVNKQRVIICRVNDDSKNHYPYLPFAVGCVVIGDVIINSKDNKEYFKISKCYIDYSYSFAVQIFNNFKNRYNYELENKIILNYSNN